MSKKMKRVALDSSPYGAFDDSKKMKRVALESSSYGGFEDPKAMLKHQRLLQDYQELQKETDDIRHKLEDAKLGKLRLLTEVRFLLQRRKYLLQSKTLNHVQGQELVALPNSKTYPKNGSKDQVTSKKEAKLNKLPPLPGLKQKGRIQVAREAASKKKPDIHANRKNKQLCGGNNAILHSSSISGLNHKLRVYRGKEVPFRKGSSAFDLKQNDRLFTANNAASRSTAAAFDLNQDTGHSGKEATFLNRVPAFDLNEISMGEEEAQAHFEPVTLEESRRIMRNLNDDQHNDLKLLVCRNVGAGTSRAGKRKISWQDSVALRV